MASKITLEEVARLAGVSTSTVSRHLNGTHFVADDKAAAIEQSIQRLNYRPNLVARGLARGRRGPYRRLSVAAVYGPGLRRRCPTVVGVDSAAGVGVWHGP